MAANIFGGRFMGNREPAWHQLGTVFTSPITATQAIAQGKMDYRVEKYPLQGVQETPFGHNLIPVPGKFGLFREPTEDDPETRCFGVVGPTYKVIQNVELGQMLDPLTEKWPVETAGALGFGETIFLTLHTGKHSIKGEELLLYFLVSDTKDGDSSVRVAFTPVRVVCQNTLTAGLKASVVNVAISHHQGVVDELKFRLDLVKKMQDVQESMVANFEQMAEAILLPHNVEEILKLAYPAPARPRKAQLVLDEIEDAENVLPENIFAEATDIQERWEYYQGMAGKRRDQATALFDKFNSEFPETAGTAWALYNAVVENEDFREGPESMFGSAVFGQRAATKRKCYDAIWSVIGS
jgi:phage/plasmid-like protein (TIGR03299 family)